MDLEGMQRQMTRVMEQMFSPILGRAGVNLPSLGNMQAFIPNVEVFTSGNDLIVRAELAGIDPKDVDVEITDEAVHVSGEMKRESEIEDDAYYHSERQYGRFERIIPLPNRIKDQDAKATFRNGLLEIRAPLAEQPQKPQARKLNIIT